MCLIRYKDAVRRSTVLACSRICTQQRHWMSRVHCRFLQNIAARGLKLIVTELDVLETETVGSVSSRDQIVADCYDEFLSVALDERAVSALVIWGLADGFSWQNAPSRTHSDAPTDCRHGRCHSTPSFVQSWLCARFEGRWRVRPNANRTRSDFSHSRGCWLGPCRASRFSQVGHVPIGQIHPVFAAARKPADATMPCAIIPQQCEKSGLDRVDSQTVATSRSWTSRSNSIAHRATAICREPSVTRRCRPCIVSRFRMTQGP